jgi:hypothetical protein
MLLLSADRDVVAQRSERPGQMFFDGAGRNAEQLGGAAGIHVEAEPQGDHLPLPDRQPQQRRHNRRTERDLLVPRGDEALR